MRANGAGIRSIRQRRGETIEQVAVRAEVAASAWRAIENGDTPRPRMLTLRAMARVLEVEIADITVDLDSQPIEASA